MKTRFLTITGLAALSLATSVLSPALAHQGEHDDDNKSSVELTSKQRNEIRAGTKRFRDVDKAIAAGYIPTDVCVALPGVGGMGYHYVNPANLMDGVIDPAKPEILVFHKDRKGRLQLGAVEYFAPDADQDLSTDSDRPSLFGNAFEGPMPGHEPGMPVHYDLHVWVYTDNPAGQLAAWNPNVTCD